MNQEFQLQDKQKGSEEIRPKVSVIIPIYNVEQYLEECLVSALHQTLREIEIICVNDGSPDHSMDIVRVYAEKDPRIVIIEKENGGLSSARNAGMNAAKGECIYFLDSDDYIDPETLEKLYAESKKEQLDLIFFDAECFYENEELQDCGIRMDQYIRKNDYSEVVSGLRLLQKMDDHEEFRPSACLYLTRTDFLREYKISFYEGIIHEDNLFTLECLLDAQRVKHIPKKFYKRRVREGSIMTNSKVYTSSYGYFKGIEMLLEKLDGKNYPPDLEEAFIYRLCVMQSNALNLIKDKDDFETDRWMEDLPFKERAMYKLLIARMARERHYVELYRQRVKDTKTSSSARIGEAVTFVPSKTKAFYKKSKKYGTAYTFWSEENRRKPSDNIFVSIIMPVYNARKYLQPCLDSLISQTLKNIEIICVNDGSKDDSIEILKEYALKDKRIQVIDKKNTGAGDCRNIGLKKAKGEYVLFLDADDEFNRGLCEVTYYKAKKEQADICFFGSRRFNMETGETVPMGWVLRTNLLPKKTPFVKEQLGDKFFQITSGCPWSKLFRREFILENRLTFMNLKNSNDLYFVRTAMAKAQKMTYISESMVTYRVGIKGSTQKNKARAPLEFYKAYKALQDKLEEDTLYKDLEKSFVNLVLNDCLFNLQTANSPESKQLIRDTLKNEGFAYFHLLDKPTEYFFDEQVYNEFRKMMEENQ